MSEEPGLQGGTASSVRGRPREPTRCSPAIRGTSSFEWLDGQRFVIWRSHYDHSQIPDAITIIGVTNGQLSMHYFDERGVYRV